MGLDSVVLKREPDDVIEEWVRIKGGDGRYQTGVVM